MEETELCFPHINSSCRKQKPSYTEAVLSYTLLSFISLLTTSLNLLVIISISHFKQLHTPSNLLLLSLAVSDFFVGLLMSFLIIFTDGCWYLGDQICAVYSFLDSTIVTAPVGTMVLISVDRYVAICDPLHYHQKITARAMRCHIAAVTIKPSKTRLQEGSNTGGLMHVMKSEIKAARTLGIVVITFLTCYCPYYFSSFAEQNFLFGFTSVAIEIWIFYFNSCLNPLIYAFFYPWFRRSVKLIVTLKIFQHGSSKANILLTPIPIEMNPTVLLIERTGMQSWGTNESRMNVLDVFGVQESLCLLNYSDPESITLWFSLKMAPLLPFVNEGLLIQLANQDFSCSAFQELKQKRSYTEAVLTFTLLSFISLLTTTLNLLVIISISHFKQLHTPTNLLLLSLAVSDFFVGLLMSFLIILTDGCWFLGDPICTLYGSVSYIVTFAAVGTMVLISADRYVAICNPLNYHQKITARAMRCHIAAVTLKPSKTRLQEGSNTGGLMHVMKSEIKAARTLGCEQTPDMFCFMLRLAAFSLLAEAAAAYQTFTSSGEMNITSCPITYYGKKYDKLYVGFSANRFAVCFRGSYTPGVQNDCILMSGGTADRGNLSVLTREIPTGSGVHKLLPNLKYAGKCVNVIPLRDSQQSEIGQVELGNFHQQSILAIKTYSGYTSTNVRVNLQEIE
ncbi:uncharacterized protein [Leuresthes tenuis]|uniref:uncharacterized protein n=1 Tax=Leuresthes tenuis TaxID=355514 RepID=UPI003B5031F1